MWPQPTPSVFCKVAAITWFAYDLLITVNDEILYVWNQPRGFLNTLYFMTRYGSAPIILVSVIVNLSSGVSAVGCTVLSWIEAIGTFYIFFCVQAILQYRIYMMYSKSRFILLLNLGLLIVEFVVALTLAILFLADNKEVLPSPSVQGSCFDESTTKAVVALSVPCVVYECWLLVLCMRQARLDFDTRKKLDTNSIVFQLSLDSLTYFLMIIIAIVSMMTVTLLNPVTPGSASISFVHVAESIAGYRLILRTREAAMAPSQRVARNQVSLSTMRFDTHPLTAPRADDSLWEMDDNFTRNTRTRTRTMRSIEPRS